MSKIINFLQYKQENEKRNAHTRPERKKYARMKTQRISPMDIKNTIRNSEELLNNNSKCADMILEAFRIDASKTYVPIISILNSLGIKVYKQKMEPEELSAYISVDPEYHDKYGTTKIACVNEDDNVGHSRFALAHELAHYIFDYDETEQLRYFSTYIRDDKYKDSTEKKANDFAANLLMPKEIFIQKKNFYERETGKSKPDVIVNLAEHFGVSTKSILKRFDEVLNTD